MLSNKENVSGYDEANIARRCLTHAHRQYSRILCWLCDCDL